MTLFKGSRTRYGIAFGIFAIALGWNAWRYGGWAWVLLWPAVSFAIAAAGYLVLGPRVMGKSALGDFQWWSHIILLPFRLFVLLGWYVGRLLTPGPACCQIAPGVWLGRRVGAHELPAGTRLVIDLTSEMSVPRRVRDGVRRYVCVPALDRCVPDESAAREALRSIEEVAREGGGVYIHCAQGFGRSASLVAAILIRRGDCRDADEAEQRLRSLRPGVKLNPEQRRFVINLTKTNP